LTGLFVLAHDCGHRSFSDSNKVNDIVGELTMPLTLWPYEVWRLSHDHHHRHTHNARRDIAWRPLTAEQYGRLSPVARAFYRWTRTWLSGWASPLFQYFMVQDAIVGGFFAAEHRTRLMRSIAICAAIAALYVALSISFGWYGFVMLFLLPQLVFHFWLSTFTLLHHTRPEEPPMPDELWDAGKAQLGSSIHMVFPRAIDWLTHDISWHVPHHVCVGVPHYHLRAAHEALRQAFPDLVLERTASWAYWREVVAVCHLIEKNPDGSLRWLTFGENARRSMPLPTASASRI
jgi:omega-6 fatty acid desaturase (delta-12 desaturase)